jgi:hypothetical protein
MKETDKKLEENIDHMKESNNHLEQTIIDKLHQTNN